MISGADKTSQTKDEATGAEAGWCQWEKTWENMGKQEGVWAGVASQNLPGVKSLCSHSQGSRQLRLQPRGLCCTPGPSPRDSSTPRPSPLQVGSPVPPPRFPCSPHGGIPHLHHLFPEFCLVIPTFGRTSQELTLQSRVPSLCLTRAGVALPHSPRDTFLSEPPSAPRARLQLPGELEPCVGLGLNALSCVLGKCCPGVRARGWVVTGG